MTEPTHIIDSDGDALIVLYDANARFATFDSRISPVFFQTLDKLNERFWSCNLRAEHSGDEEDDALKSPPNVSVGCSDSFTQLVSKATETSRSVEAGLASRIADKALFRIQVSAKHLMFASPVFKKILTVGLKESVTYQQKGFVEINSESWDINALMILLNAIHDQHHEIPHELTLEMLAKVAVLADYYDCRQSLFVYKNIWMPALQKPIPATYSRDLILWIWVSWYFQLPVQFKQATSNAMTRRHGFITNLRLPIPADVIDAMNDSRQEAIGALLDQLHDTRDDFLAGAQGCTWECSFMVYGALSKHLASYDLLSPKPEVPFANHSYEELAMVVQTFVSPRWRASAPDSVLHCCSASCSSLLFGIPGHAIEGLNLQSFLPYYSPMPRSGS